MDSHVWRRVYQTVRSVDRSLPKRGRQKRYSDTLIVGMYLWSVWHDRPLSWAGDRAHYNGLFRPRMLPSVSQFCRRIKSSRCQEILQETYRRLARCEDHTAVSFIDGRPLVVGSCSKDVEAHPGRVYGGFARGYKLHALVTSDGRAVSWSVTSLNVSEKAVAAELIEDVRLCGFLVGDGNYDAGHLYDTVAAFQGRLLAVPREGAGGGHRRQSENRLASLFLWRRVGKVMQKERAAVERFFGNQSMYGGGLGPLPAWVRTLERVRRWVGAKI